MLAAGLDVGTGLSVLFVFLVLILPQAKVNWWGNLVYTNSESSQECPRRFSAVHLRCKRAMSSEPSSGYPQGVAARQTKDVKGLNERTAFCTPLRPCQAWQWARGCDNVAKHQSAPAKERLDTPCQSPELTRNSHGLERDCNTLGRAGGRIRADRVVIGTLPDRIAPGRVLVEYGNRAI